MVRISQKNRAHLIELIARDIYERLRSAQSFTRAVETDRAIRRYFRSADKVLAEVNKRLNELEEESPRVILDCHSIQESSRSEPSEQKWLDLVDSEDKNRPTEWQPMPAYPVKHVVWP